MSDLPLPKLSPLDRLVRVMADLGSALAGLSLLASLGLVSYSVVLRYAFNRPQSWVDEIVGYLLVATVMLAAADTLRRGEHIGVDVLTERLGPRGKKISFVVGLVAVALTAGIYVFEGWDTAMFSHITGIVSTGYLETPVWLPQLLVPLGGAVLLIAAVVALGRIAAGREAFPPIESADAADDLPKPGKPVGLE
ncbi:MAG: TRAP transporter small permease [Alphaproteobacteria bacterium]